MVQTDLFDDDPRDLIPDGVAIWRRRLDETAQYALLDAVVDVLEAAPPYRPRMRNGTQMINELSNCGALGWHSDAAGYRYIDRHPASGKPWPPIPQALIRLARTATEEVGVASYEPDACLVNLYRADGKLNLHRDYDEADFAWPIVSISLGADCVFQLGGLARKDPTTRIRLRSGDVMALFGPSRLRFHGVEKLLPGPAPFAHRGFERAARINLTLRRAR